MPSGRLAVLFFLPQLIGYARCLLLIAALAAGPNFVSWWLLLINMGLDGLDGMAARRLGQTSGFGAFLDVAVDNAVRAVAWSWGLPAPWAAFPVLLEATTFAATHACMLQGGGAAWKTGCFSRAPRWVSAVMANGFKTPPGILSVVGLFGAPLYLFSYRHLQGSWQASWLIGLVVMPGRLLAASVELWVLAAHLGGLLDADVASRRHTPASVEQAR